MYIRRALTSGFLVVGVLLGTTSLAVEPTAHEALFRDRVAPILQRRCLSCHNAQDHKGGLSLETADGARQGGDSGAAFVAGEPDASYLLEMITPKNGQAAMPKDADALSVAEQTTIREWIAGGAVWPEKFRLEEARVSNTDWWSLQPLVRPAIPEVSKVPFPLLNPIDRFIAAKHQELGLSFSPLADRRTLIRRLYFDLLGLPPSPEEVATFVADENPQAYELLVDRLLESPHYGERWTRHWLDVVHYGETHGYDKDKPRPNAWPYRDYVIRALNQDKPYSRFIQEQIAGDMLFPDSADGIEALGFIAAGPWDFIGHAEVPETKIDGKIARHLDRDDMVQNTIMTFNSVTVGCAQCHNHKFDPISQEDYYSLQAVFAALDRADRPYYADPMLTKRRDELLARQRAVTTKKKELDDRVAKLGGAELANLDRRIEAASKPAAYPPEHGYHSAIEATPDKTKWVQIDLGEPTPLTRLEYVACYDDFNNIRGGFGFPERFKIEAANDAQFQTAVQLLVDQTAENFPNPNTTLQTWKPAKEQPVTPARFVRFTATRLAPRQNDYIFALAELKVFNAQDMNVASNKPVAALDSIEAPIRWRKQNLVDGIFPGTTTTDQELAKLRTERTALLDRVLDAPLRTALDDTNLQVKEVNRELAALPPPRMVYAGMVYHGNGTFQGTGASGGQPRPVHLLPRGDIKRPGRAALPGSLSFFPNLPARFEAVADQPEGARRVALAQWLTHRDNPLTWRSIVNRVWLYHFGRGIVDTPNDFGRMGQFPTHPELLDWLAMEFRDGGQSLKQLHKRIVTSRTYQQSSNAERPAENDADNRFYWRQNRRRLEAEAIRDSILSASGKLNLTMGGPSFQDFVIDKPEHSPHYEYHLHDPEDVRIHRRSIYRFIVRSQTQPFLTTMDCADPSMQVEKRNQTITPLQALALLNNQLSVAMAQHFATRVAKEANDPAAQITRAFRLALGRDPTADELRLLQSYAADHGLANVCRVILNLNEFVFVD